MVEKYRIIGFSGPGEIHPELMKVGEIPPSGIKEVIINDQKTSQAEITNLMRKMSYELRGFMFNACLQGDTLLLGYKPMGRGEGEATLHSDVKWPLLGAGVFHGIVNNHPVEIDPFIEVRLDERTKFTKVEEKEQYIRLARFLVEHGFPEDRQLSDTTKLRVNRYATTYAISTIGDLAELKTNGEILGK